MKNRPRPSSWRLSATRTLELEPWCLMGILNATPDSFSDGGVHLDPVRAAEAGVAMVEAGGEGAAKGVWCRRADGCLSSNAASSEAANGAAASSAARA